MSLGFGSPICPDVPYWVIPALILELIGPCWAAKALRLDYPKVKFSVRVETTAAARCLEWMGICPCRWAAAAVHNPPALRGQLDRRVSHLTTRWRAAQQPRS